MRKLLRRLLIQLGRSLGLKPKGPFRRYLTRREAHDLAAKINSVLGSDLRSDVILETARMIRRIEAHMVGRIAGDIDDHVLNYYLIRHSASRLPDNVAFVEIGVLFGGSLLVMMQALKDAKVQRQIVAIDPLDSYYGENEDPITLLPITRDNVLTNVKLAKFAMANFTLISTPSELPETLEFTHRFQIGGLYIDGDHSYEGVKRDWNNYSPLVIPDGHILIDNYHDNYEGLDRFVDQEVIPTCKDWTVAGTVNRSVVFIRTGK